MHACRNHRFIAAVEGCENGGLEQGKEKAESRRRKGAQIQSWVLKLPPTAAVAINSQRLESLTARQDATCLIDTLTLSFLLFLADALSAKCPAWYFLALQWPCLCVANILGGPNLLDNHNYIAISFSFR
jgi:hypothetical protein